MQKFTGIGYLGADPTMRYTPKGKAVTNLRLAIKGHDDATMWVNVTVWGKQAEACNEYLKKGSQVYVDGRMEYDPDTGAPKTWISKKTGQTGTSFEMTAFSVEFLTIPEDKRKPVAKKEVPWK